MKVWRASSSPYSTGTSSGTAAIAEAERRAGGKPTAGLCGSANICDAPALWRPPCGVTFAANVALSLALAVWSPERADVSAADAFAGAVAAGTRAKASPSRPVCLVCLDAGRTLVSAGDERERDGSGSSSRGGMRASHEYTIGAIARGLVPHCRARNWTMLLMSPPCRR